jgi:hypothetical protein
MMMRLRTLSMLLWVLSVTVPVTAQEQRGSIQGTVKDSSGAVVPGVAIEARSAAGAVLSTTTDSNGVYRFPSVLPGTFEIAASLQSFRPEKISDVLVALGQIKTVDFTLKPAGLAEAVTVTAESPLIDVKQSTRATNIRAEQVELLPHNRDFTSLVVQAPGANYEPKSGSTGIMIDGSSAAENRYVIDGMETTEMVHGQSGKNVLADFVEEVEVKSSGYPPEYGGSTGAVINVITKSGTNRFAGTALTFWQGSNSTGSPNQTLRLNLTNPNIAENIFYPKDPENRWEPGGALGGPVMQNRAWFFAAYQPAFTTTTRTVNAATSGNATAALITKTQKQEVQYFTGNQTTQLGDKLRTRLAFNNSWNQRDGQLPTQNGNDNPATNYTKGTKFPNWTLSGNADYVLSSQFLIGVRAGYFRSDTHDYNVIDQARFTFGGGTNNLNMPGVPASEQHPTNYQNILSGANSGTTYDTLSRTFIQADATWYAHARGGDHQIKGGVQIDRRGENILSGELEHIVTLDWGVAYTDPNINGGKPVTGQFGTYEVRSNAAFPKQGLVTTGNVQSNLVGVFIQDTWTVNNKLTINGGLRTENEKVPAYTTAPGVTSYPIKYGMGDKLAPRAGFAYDVKGDGRWKAYGSWGIFYDIFKLNLPQGSFGGQKWIQYYYTLDTPVFENVGFGSNCPPQCPGGNLITQIDERQPSVTPGVDIETNLKPMKSQEAVFGLEHQLGPSLAVIARYVHKQLNRAIEDTGSIDAATNAEAYIIANPGAGLTQTFNLVGGRAVYAGGSGTYTLPAGKRLYDAAEFGLDKRLANNWSFRGTYTLSRDYGNYPGLSESDENGRSDPNSGRLWDYPLEMFNGRGVPEYGLLPTDRTHAVKMQGIYQFKFGATVGANEYVATGIPISRSISVLAGHNYPMYYLGRGSDGRTPVYSQTDLYVQQEFRIGGRRRLQLSANVLNLFDQRTVIDRFNTMRRTGSSIAINEAAFYSGQVNVQSVVDAAVAAKTLTLDPRLLMNSSYQSPILARFGVKLIF